MVEIRNLNDQNFGDFIELLKIRGEAPDDYYRWKYLDQPAYGRPTGFIGYFNQQPVGCIGIINRIFIKNDTSLGCVTWFADWFILDQVRGKGVGQLLMEEVRSQATIGFGIPGPIKAQGVCKKSGYTAVPDFYEIELSLNRWRVGYRRYSGSILKRILRGCREILLKDNIRGFDAFFTLGKPSVSAWVAASKIGLKGVGHLAREKDFLQWFMDMPLSTHSARQWWYFESDLFFATGFFETDIWGLKKAKVIDLIPLKDSFDKALRSVASVLKNNGMDILVAFQKNSHSKSNYSKIPIPMHQTGNVFNLSVSLLDKESSWREFNMIPV